MGFHFPQKDEICASSGQSVIAVDLGFAGNNKSCGLAWQRSPDENCQKESADFAYCIKRTARFLSENTDPILIVEAPLSGLFDCNGNPEGRQPFEKESARTRYWYVGPGAAVGLGAIFFFSRLSELLDSEPSAKISVIEGFISFKASPTKDSEDALALLNAFRNPHGATLHEVAASANERSINCLSFAGLFSSESTCPVVLAVKV